MSDEFAMSKFLSSRDRDAAMLKTIEQLRAELAGARESINKLNKGNTCLSEENNDLRVELAAARNEIALQVIERDELKFVIQKRNEELATLRQSQQAGEPVAWRHRDGMLSCRLPGGGVAGIDWTPLYEAPQPSEDARDAARYRWLRENEAVDYDLIFCEFLQGVSFPPAESEIYDDVRKQIDWAIDTAMRKGAEK